MVSRLKNTTVFAPNFFNLLKVLRKLKGSKKNQDFIFFLTANKFTKKINLFYIKRQVPTGS